MPWEWKSMEVKICIGEAISFGKMNCFLWENKTPKNVYPFHSPFMFSYSSCSWSLLGVFPHDFLHLPHSSKAGSRFLCCTADG